MNVTGSLLTEAIGRQQEAEVIQLRREIITAIQTISAQGNQVQRLRLVRDACQQAVKL